MPPKRNRLPGSTSTTHNSGGTANGDAPSSLAQFSRVVLNLEKDVPKTVFVEKLRDACSKICTTWGHDDIEIDKDSLNLLRCCFRHSNLMQSTTGALIEEKCISKLVTICKKVPRFPMKEWAQNPKMVDQVVDKSYMILLDIMWIFSENIEKAGVKDLINKMQEVGVEDVFHRVLLGREYFELGRALVALKLLLPCGKPSAKEKLEPIMDTLFDLLVSFHDDIKHNRGGGSTVFQIALSLVTEFSSNRHKPVKFYTKIIPCLQDSLERFLLPRDGQLVLKEALWILSYISDEGSRLPDVINEKLVKDVARILKMQEDPTRYPALRLIGNFCSGDDAYTSWVIDSGALKQLPKFLHESSTQDSKVEALRIISNIAAGTRQQLLWLMHSGYVQETIRYLDTKVHYTVRREAIWVTKNLADVGAIGCIDFLVDECDFPRGFAGTLRSESTPHRRLSPVLASLLAMLCGDSWRDWLRKEGYDDKPKEESKPGVAPSSTPPQEGNPGGSQQQEEDEEELESYAVSPVQMRELWLQKKIPPSIIKIFQVLIEMEIERELIAFSKSTDSVVAEGAGNTLAWYRAVLGSSFDDSSVSPTEKTKVVPDPDDEEFNRYPFHGRGALSAEKVSSLSLGPRFFTETETGNDQGRAKSDFDVVLRLVAPYLVSKAETVLGSVQHSGSSIFTSHPDTRQKNSAEKVNSK